jgi:hypothetical protein
MRGRLGATSAAITATLVLIGVPSASAATEVGTDCAAEIASVGTTLVPLTRSSQSPWPIAVPAAGVVTKWNVFWTSESLAPVPQKLKVVRPTGGPNEFQVVAESPVEGILKGRNSFDTRIPVQAGDRFGLYGPGGHTLFCDEAGVGETMGFAFDDIAPGSIATFTPQADGEQVPVIAVVEPDGDGDGYGDETQDLCPQNPNVHTACPQLPPPITLDPFPIVLERSVLVLVSASAESSVEVFGQVRLGVRQKKGGASSSKTRKPGDPIGRRVIARLSGGPQTVAPGQVARFNVKLPKPVKRLLGQIAPNESLKATITARTADFAGRISERTITVRLKGQK